MTYERIQVIVTPLSGGPPITVYEGVVVKDQHRVARQSDQKPEDQKVGGTD